MKKIFIIILFIINFNITLIAQSISRIEPQNWWTNMKLNKITLLVYGKNINHLTPNIDYKGVSILKSEKTENKNYLFITIEISTEAKAGIVKINFKDNNKTIITQNFPILERDKNNYPNESFSTKDAILLIVPDRFSNGDTQNDDLKTTLEKSNRKNMGGRHGGDIQGIINHLDYIKSMGFTQIWNTPLIENDMPEYSYHGYAATDFYKIDPRFGTNEQFKNLVKEAKKRGIAVIWDVVLNHCGSEYYFMKDKPTKDWVNYPDSLVLTNHLKSTFLDPYATELDKKEYVEAWFVPSMPDLNQKNPHLAAFLTQNTIWWIEYAGLSGFRVDTFSYSDKNFLTNWTKTILEEYPSFNIVGEEWTADPELAAYWQINKNNKDNYKCYLPSVMDFGLFENIVKSLNTESSWASSWKSTYELIAKDYHYPNPNNLLIFPDNHDIDRIYSQLNQNFEHWKLAMTIFTTMRGIPQFQYGTELLMSNKEKGSHSQIRGDFYGGWNGDTKDAKTGKGLDKNEALAQEFLKNLLNWRKNKKVIHQGKLKHYAPLLNDVYVYFRYNDNEKVMVILNKNKNKVTLHLDRYKEMIPSTIKTFDIISQKEITFKNILEIEPKTAMILEIR